MLAPYALKTEIIPSPGTQIKDWETMKEKIDVLKACTSGIHLDLLDGKFADNANFMDPEPFKEYAKDLRLEAHFMTDNPLQYLESFAKAGFVRFIGQIEKMPDIAAFVAAAEQLGEVGLAVDSETSIESIFPYLEDLDVAFVMTVKAGFSGQSFLPDQLEKVKALREKAPFLPIEIDGGVNDKTIIDAKKAGATRFVTTGFLFDSPNPAHQYELLKKALEEA